MDDLDICLLSQFSLWDLSFPCFLSKKKLLEEHLAQIMQNCYIIALDSTFMMSHNYHVYFSLLLVRKRKALDFFRRGVYSCFTMLCWFLLCNEVNQFYVCPWFYTSHPHPLIQPIWVTTECWAELLVLYCRYTPPKSTYPYSMSGSLFLPWK